MIRITHTIAIDDREIKFRFARSTGPGGQNVNKVSTAVQLRFDLRNSMSLSDDVRNRLTHLAGKRLTGEGVLTIEARRFRTQERNRQDAIERLVAIIRQAAKKPAPRRRTRPTLASERRRLEAKRHRSETKSRRQSVPSSED